MINKATEPTPWFSRKTLAERSQDMCEQWKNKADAKSAFWQVQISSMDLSCYRKEV